MASKKRKYTEQELKDKLWEMAQSVDWEDEGIYDIEAHEDYDDWAEAMTNRTGKLLSMMLTTSTVDVAKIIKALESQAVSDRVIRNFRHALKNATTTVGQE